MNEGQQTIEVIVSLIAQGLGVLVIMIALAFLVETLTEFLFGTLFDKVPKLTPYKWTLMYIAVVVGLIGAFTYQFDLLAILGKVVGSNIGVQWYGIAITGVAIGK